MFRVYLYYFFLFSALAANAQEGCQLTLPAETVLIAKSPLTEKLGKDQTYWICNRAQVTFRAGNAVIFIDSGAKVNIGYGQYTIYIKDGAYLNLNSGAKAVIYLEGNPIIQQMGFNAQESRIPCEAFKMDISQAPAEICPTPLARITEPIAPNKPALDTLASIGLEIKPSYLDLDNSHIIPAEAQVIPFKIRVENTTGNHKIFWLCKNAKIVHQGDSSVFYLEEGAELSVVSGNHNRIFIKQNCKLNLGPGRGNTVFYQEGVILGSDKSYQTRFTKLIHIEFDYSQVSSKGCH